MPITFLSVLGLFLLVLAALPAAVLLLGGKKRAALAILCVPLGMILLPIPVICVFGIYGHSMSSHPERLFERTFHCEPPSGTEVLNGYCSVSSDFGLTALRFRTTREVLDKIVPGNFVRSDRKTCLWGHENGYSNLPPEVLSWFLPPRASAVDWYTATEFDRTFAREEAILGYDGQTQTAYFYWCGVD